MNCTRCGLAIILIPSAADRARKLGGNPSDFTQLFTKHPECEVLDRNEAVQELIQRKS